MTTRLGSTRGRTEGVPLPRAVWLLSWVSFLADVSSEMVYPLLPLFLVGVLGSTKTQLGAIEGAAVLVVAVMTGVAGWRSDLLRKRIPWIRVGYGLPVLGKAIIALATAWPMVLGGRLLDRFGKGLRGAPRDALIVDAVGIDQRGRAFGVHRAFDTAGALVGVLLSAFLLWWLTGTPEQSAAATHAAKTPGWVYRAIFGVGAALGLASLVLTLLLRESGAAKSDSTGTRAVPPRMADTSIPTAGWLELPRSYWSVLLVLLLFSLANSSDTFLLLRASDLGFSPWTVVLLYALFNLTYAAVSYPAGALSDSVGRWRVIGGGWALYVVVYAGFALVSPASAWGLWPLMAAYGVYMGLTEGVGKALIADHAPANRRGTAMGLFYAATGFTTLFASLIAGLAWDRAGAPAAFTIGAAFAAVAVLTLAIVRARLVPHARTQTRQ